MPLQLVHSNARFCWIVPAEGTIDILKESGNYCPSCFSITKDLSLFVRPPSEETPRENLFIKWIVNLRETATAAENGCQWCSFIAVRVFDNPIASFISRNASAETIVGCCAADESGPSKQVSKAVEKIRSFLLGEPDAELTLVAQPSDQLLDLSYGRIRFTVIYDKKANNEKMQSLLGMMNELNVEVYAVKGMDFVAAVLQINHVE